MIDTRIFYQKKGRIRYISHLDMNRLMQRAFKRSRLPVWYTQGFNPHLYLTFALPLSLGFESEYEVMDIRLNEPLEEQEIVRALGEQMPCGLDILMAAAPQEDVREIGFCDYEIFLETPGKAEEALSQANAFFDGPIVVEKKTKRGSKSLDIAPLVEPLSLWTRDPDTLGMSLRCVSGSETNINPALAVGEFCARHGYDPDETLYCRKAIRNSKGELFR